MTKQLAESLAKWYHVNHELPVVCVRPFSVYGPRMRPDLAMSIFADRLLRGETIHLNGDGSYRRDMTHVSDICRGIYSAMTCPDAVGHSINLGNGRPIAIRDLVDRLNTQLSMVHANGGAGHPEAVATASDAATVKLLAAPRVVMHATVPEDLPVTHADLELAATLLGYEPRVRLDEGIADFAAWRLRPDAV